MQDVCGILSPVAWRLYNIFPHYLIYGTIFEKKGYWRQNVNFDFHCKFCLKHFSLQQELDEILSQMTIGLHVKFWSFLSYFNKIWIFSIDFRKILKYRISWKLFLRKLNSSMQTDRQIGTTKITVAFRNFATRVKNESFATEYNSVVKRQCQLNSISILGFTFSYNTMNLGKWATWCTNSFLCIYFYLQLSTYFEHIVLIIRIDKLYQYILW